MEINQNFSIQTIEMAANRMPVICEKNSKDWVMFGEENLYPDYIHSLFTKSSKNASILSTMSDMIVGEGFIETPELETFLANPFNKETLQQMLPKIAFDLVLYGGFALNVIWSNDKKTISQIKYVDVNKVRCAKFVNEDEPEYFYISRDWGNVRKKENEPIKIQGYSTEFKDEKSQLMYVKKYRPGMAYYALPHYISCVNYIELDYEVSNFHLQSTLNGYTPAMIINFAQGIPTPEKQAELKKKLDSQFQGTDNSGKIILSFSEGADAAVTVSKIDLNAGDERFILLEQQIMQNILIANKATSPMLFGVRVEGALGGRTELLEAYEMYQMTVISKFQEVICNALNELAKVNGVTTPIEIERYKIFEEIKTQETQGGIA